SLRHFSVAVSEPSPWLPQFMSVMYVDGTLISHYNSETGRKVPRVKWMEANMDPEYWDRGTQVCKHTEQIFHVNLDDV
ncbi:HA1K protein, partial [Urocolius indicus]|nr:HA1K protein [Urocolius indicus]